MDFTDEIRGVLCELGCGIVGFADLRGISKEARQNFDYGILIGLAYTRDAMRENRNGRPERYYAEFKVMNSQLNMLGTMTADYITGRGFKALAKVQSTVAQDEDFRTVLPHKTVAVLAGIGWIGKCAALVTKEVGSALRITVVLTNALLTCGTPVMKSACGACMACLKICPGNAPHGGLWEAGVDRDEFFDAHACYKAARARAKETLNIEETVCGLCISHCPFTKKGLGYE